MLVLFSAVGGAVGIDTGVLAAAAAAATCPAGALAPLLFCACRASLGLRAFFSFGLPSVSLSASVAGCSLFFRGFLAGGLAVDVVVMAGAVVDVEGVFDVLVGFGGCGESAKRCFCWGKLS